MQVFGTGHMSPCEHCIPEHLCRPAYPSIFDRISTEIGQQYDCTGVFLKIQRVFRKYGSRNVNKCEFVANKLDL